MFATIYVLCYGKYTGLHRRVLESLDKALPEGEAKVVVLCNQLAKESLDFIIDIVMERNGEWIMHKTSKDDENVPKYEVMRDAWWGRNKELQPTTPWILWLDDDTYIAKPDWWEKTKEFIRSKYEENVCYVGDHWYVHHLPGQQQFIAESVWYKGREPELLPTRSRKVKKPGITFATGAYVWLRTDIMRELHWPDARLVHNGGDTLLAEAIRQRKLPRHKFKYGVKINDAKRRGRSDKPAGSTVNVKR